MMRRSGTKPERLPSQRLDAATHDPGRLAAQARQFGPIIDHLSTILVVRPIGPRKLAVFSVVTLGRG